MAFTNQNTAAYPGQTNTNSPAFGTGTATDANVAGVGQKGYNTSEGHGLTSGLTGGQGLTGGHKSGLAGGDVCDPPHVYNAGLNAEKHVRHVTDDGRERMFEAPRVEETVVHHEVERIKPVVHQEVHQTRLHERTHHKVEAPRDMGVTEVVQHRDTDPCGNRITEDLNAVRGGTAGVKNLVEGVKSKLTGHDHVHGTSGMTGTTGMTGNEYGSTGTRNDKFATGGTTADIAPASATGYGTTGTGAYDNNQATTVQEPGGVKGLINKVVPGPGPFKPVEKPI